MPVMLIRVRCGRRDSLYKGTIQQHSAIKINAEEVEPWILCGPGLPPLSTGDSAGSTATVFMDGFTDFKYYDAWVMKGR